MPPFACADDIGALCGSLTGYPAKPLSPACDFLNEMNDAPSEF